MQCTNPITLSGVEVPCNKCIGCRIAISRDWSCRILHELEYYKESCFITLTYNEENIPKTGSIVKEDLRNFMKRLRKNTKKKIKYFACGDYGEEKGRPHYHLITLGINYDWEGFKYKKTIKSKGKMIKIYEVDEWTNGFVHVGTVTPDSVRYVTDYVMRSYSGTLLTEKYGKKENPFRSVSQGLGRQFCLDNQEKLKREECTQYQGVRVGLPRYYRNILEIKNPVYTNVLKERAYMKELEQRVTFLETTGSLRYEDNQEMLNKMREQFEKQYEKKKEIYNAKMANDVTISSNRSDS